VNTKIIAAAFLTLALTSCNQGTQNQQNPAPPGSENVQRDSASIVVTDSKGQPLAGAKVLIGTSLDKPFANNFLTTDQNGMIAIPKEWTSAQPVTIQAADHTRLTYLNQMPSGQSFKIHSHAVQFDREIKGMGTGVEAFMKEKDGYVDFSVVTPTITLEDVFLFSTGQLLSPEMDSISALGQEIKVPSNLSLPEQKEKAGLFSFTIKKPTFRLKVASNADTALVATRARAKVSDLQDVKGPELFNATEFFSSGIQNIPAGTGPLTQNVPADTTTYNSKVDVVAPNFGGSDVMSSMTLINLNPTQLYITDIKNHGPGDKWQLAIPAGSTPYVAFTWKKKNAPQNRAASLMLARPGQAPLASNFLQMIAKPKMTGSVLTFTPPNGVSGVAPTATYIALSDVLLRSQDLESEVTVKKWEIVSSEWISQVEIPTWPENEVQSRGTHRWDVVFLGHEGNASDNTAVGLDFSGVTHATRNSVEF
jgi:hypothetical protein